MHLKPYHILRRNTYVFEFISIGENLLLKQVKFTEMKYDPDVYNIALGTVLQNGKVDFNDSSNNGDVAKVFSTVIRCIKIFLSEFPDKFIFFKGNTAQKNRVYNEIIRRHYDKFSLDFHIFGVWFTEGKVVTEKYEHNKNYTGFYIEIKN